MLTVSTCKKKPDEFIVSVYDPFMDKEISDAEVSLVEFSWGGGILSPSGNCKIIKTATTDNNGVANLTGAKLKRNDKYNYFVAVSKCYGKTAFFSCANHPSSDYLTKTTKDINKKIYHYADQIDWKLNINGLNSGGFGALNSDSISVSIYRDFPYIADFSDTYNGSKQLVKMIYLNKTIYSGLYYPTLNPETYGCCTYNYLDKIWPGKYKIDVYKNKGGMITTYTYYEVAQPVTQYQFNLNW